MLGNILGSAASSILNNSGNGQSTAMQLIQAFSRKRFGRYFEIVD